MTVWEFITGHVDENVAKVGFSGLAGGAVRWMTLRSDWKTGLIGMAVGGLFAIYGRPVVDLLIGPVLAFVSDDILVKAQFSGFIAGIGGITVTGFLIDYIAARRKKLDAGRDETGKPK